MQEWLVLLFALGTLASAVAGGLAWIAKIRWSDEFRAAHESILKAKDAQIAQIQETVKSKDATIESLRLFTYSEAEKHITALKNLHEQRLTGLTSERDELQAHNTELMAQVDQLSVARVDEQTESQTKLFEDLVQQVINLRLRQIDADISSTSAALDTLYKANLNRYLLSPSSTPLTLSSSEQIPPIIGGAAGNYDLGNYLLGDERST